MKILKSILKIAIALIAVILISALFVSKEFNYEKSININAPIDSVWAYTNSLNSLELWSPWNDYDPGMERTFTGTDGTIGSKISWVSDHPNVGSGSQTIVKIVPPSLFETKLQFVLPYESEAVGKIKLHSDGTQTVVNWGFESEMPYPFNLMKVFMNMDDAIGKDFQTGLDKLQRLCEEE